MFLAIVAIGWRMQTYLVEFLEHRQRSFERTTTIGHRNAYALEFSILPLLVSLHGFLTVFEARETLGRDRLRTLVKVRLDHDTSDGFVARLQLLADILQDFWLVAVILF